MFGSNNRRIAVIDLCAVSSNVLDVEQMSTVLVVTVWLS